jgi:hypothetical protein
MRPQPFDPSELGIDDHSLDAVTMALERYAAGADPVHDQALTARIRSAIDAEPLPRRGWLPSLAALVGRGSAGGRALALAGVAAAAIAVAVAVGGLLDLARTIEPGATPIPVISPSIEQSPSVPPSPSASELSSPTPSPSPSASGSASASDSPDESASPSESDSSGPGGGGGDNSGPGSSGSGSGSSGSGSGSGSGDGGD